MKLVIFYLFSISFVFSVHAEEAGIPSLSTEQKVYGLSLVWSEVKNNFAFLDKNPELDLDREYINSLVRISSTDSTYDYYKELARFTALLNDGHTKVMLPYDLYKNDIDWPDVYLHSIENKVVVTGVGSRYQSRLPVGSEIVSVNGIPVRDYIDREVYPYFSGSSYEDRWNLAVSNLFFGLSNSKFLVGFNRPNGQYSEIPIVSNSKSNDDTINRIKLFDYRKSNTNFSWLADNVAYLSINSFKDKEVIDEFVSLLPKLNKSRGLILDLRFNRGGSTSIVNEIASYLTNKPLTGSSWKYRINNSVLKLGKVPNIENWFYGNGRTLDPKSNAINVPTAILIGQGTGSAALEFLVLTDDLDSFRTYGVTTNTSTGQTMKIDLPGGGIALICIKRDSFPDGREIVGVGIKPDVVIELTINNLLLGEDKVLEKALLDLKDRI